jgi:hypothetical protein
LGEPEPVHVLYPDCPQLIESLIAWKELPEQAVFDDDAYVHALNVDSQLEPEPKQPL